MLTEQEMLDLIDAMPPEHKGVSVETKEDGTGVVHMKEFLIHYGRALLEAVEKKTNGEKEAE